MRFDKQLNIMGLNTNKQCAFDVIKNEKFTTVK